MAKSGMSNQTISDLSRFEPLRPQEHEASTLPLCHPVLSVGLIYGSAKRGE